MILKFFMGESYNVMSCNHYHVTKLKSGVIEVTLYPKYTSSDGVTYRVAGFGSRCETPHFDECLVLNDNANIIELITGDDAETLNCGVENE